MTHFKILFISFNFFGISRQSQNQIPSDAEDLLYIIPNKFDILIKYI